MHLLFKEFKLNYINIYNGDIFVRMTSNGCLSVKNAFRMSNLKS